MFGLGTMDCFSMPIKSAKKVLPKSSSTKQSAKQVGTLPAVCAADWMSELCQVNTTITLKDLVIPGSNDSASYSFEFQPFATAIQTQNLSILEQLEAGIRYLDIRVGPSQNLVVARSPSNISICNGFLEGATLESILQDIKSFCDAHSECIIIEISPLQGSEFHPDQKFVCLDTITKYFGGEEKRKADKYKYIIPARRVPEVITTVPLVEVIHSTPKLERQQPADTDTVSSRRSKDIAPPSPENPSFLNQYNQQQQQQQDSNSKIILLLNDRFLENEFEDDDVDERFYCMTSKLLCHPRNETNDVSILLEKSLDNLHRYEQFKYFICTKFVLTPGVKHALDVFNIIRGGGNSIRPLTMAMQLYDSYALDDFVIRYSSAGWGICAIDYVDLCPDLLDFMIALNFAFTPPPQDTNTASNKIQRDDDESNVSKERKLLVPKTSKPAIKLNFVLIESTKESSCSIQFRKVMTPENLSSESHLYRNTLVYFKDPIREFEIPEEYQTSNNHFRFTVGYTVRSGKKKLYHVVTIPFRGDNAYPLLAAPFFCMGNGSDVVSLEVNESERNAAVTGNCKRNHKGKHALDLITLATVVNFFLCNKKTMYTKKITFMLN
jgi:hypothetical protein